MKNENSQPFLSHPPMRPLPTPSARHLPVAHNYFVDAEKGADRNDGSEAFPWGTIAHALTQADNGANILLRGGVYYENVRVARVGREDAPMTLRSYPGELAIIDGGVPDFYKNRLTAWEKVAGEVPDYFRSVRAYPNFHYLLGWFGDSMVPLLTYQHRCDIEEASRRYFEVEAGRPFPLPVYFGPGIWYDAATGYVYVRLTPTNYGTDFDYPGCADYQGVRDPREVPMVIAPSSAQPLYLDGAAHIVLQDLVVRGGGVNSVLLRDCQHLTFDNVIIYCGTYGLRSQSSGPVRFLHSALRGALPPWYVQGAGCLRNIPGPRTRHEPDSGQNKKQRDVARLNTHVMVALEGRTEEMVNYVNPGNHHWEFAHSDFTDGFDGIHLSGECIEFHHNRVDRFFDDALYLTPLTPRYLNEVHVFQNLFTRCHLALGFGGVSSPGGPIYVYRNVFDLRVYLPTSHGKSSVSQLICTHFRNYEEVDLGDFFFYHNTIISCAGRFLYSVQDTRYSYALGVVSAPKKNGMRRVFNNLFVHLEGMVPPDARTMPTVDLDVQIDGSMHWDLANPHASTAKLEAYRRSDFFYQTQSQYPPGWEANARIGDPHFVCFCAEPWAANDYRIQEGSSAIEAGVILPAALVDPMRVTNGGLPDCGALPRGAEPLRAGRQTVEPVTNAWLERSSITALPARIPAHSSEYKVELTSAWTETSATVASAVAALRERGFCVLADVVSADIALACFRDAYSLLLGWGINATKYLHNTSWQQRAVALMEGIIDPTRIDSLMEAAFYVHPRVINDVQTFVAYLSEIRMRELTEIVLGKEARVTLTTLFVHDCGTRRGPWHVGRPFNPDFVAHHRSPYVQVPPYLTLHLLCSDFTTANGGLLAVPGSHLRPTNPGFEPKPQRQQAYHDEIHITGGAGSVVLMDSRLWHGVASNDGDFPRVSVVVEMAPAAEKLPKNLERLIVPRMSANVFGCLPASVQPLFAEWCWKMQTEQ